MRKLVIFLSVTTALFAASTIYLLTGRRESAVAHTVADAAAAATRADPGSSPSGFTAAPAAATPVAAAPASAQTGLRLGDLDRRFLADAADPARRPGLIAATKTSLKAEYQRLAQVVGLSPEENEHLLDYLAEQQVAGRESYLSCIGDPSKSPTGKAEGCPVDMNGLDENLLAILGPERQKRFERYLTSLEERRLVSRMRGVLPDDQFLSDDKADALTAALAEENDRRQAELGDAFNGPDRIYSEAPLVYTSGATRESLTAEGREHFDRLRARAAKFLTPAQLKTWDSIMEQRFGGVEYAIQSFLEHRAGEEPH